MMNDAVCWTVNRGKFVTTFPSGCIPILTGPFSEKQNNFESFVPLQRIDLNNPLRWTPVLGYLRSPASLSEEDTYPSPFRRRWHRLGVQRTHCAILWLQSDGCTADKKATDQLNQARPSFLHCPLAVSAVTRCRGGGRFGKRWKSMRKSRRTTIYN